jgi:hypothetical protein
LNVNDAIKHADTEYVVFFLLTAYVETLVYYDPPRSWLPNEVKRLPIAGQNDVAERRSALRRATHARRGEPSRGLLVLQEAIEVFNAAAGRLEELRSSNAGKNGCAIDNRIRLSRASAPRLSSRAN